MRPLFALRFILVSMRRQLQHNRVLSKTETRHQHDLAVCEFQSIVVRILSRRIDLTKTRHGLSKFSEAETWDQPGKELSRNLGDDD
jgi:hypothetical protein